MTYAIPVDSTRRGSSEMFGRELRRAMAARKVGQRTLADAVGTGRTSVVNYMQGNTMPRLAQADAMAVVLNWPALSELIREMRAAICRTCGAEFLNDSSARAWYCRNDRCRRVMAKKRVGVPVAKRADNAERDLAAALSDLGAHQLAVADFCGECEPEGLCKTSDCPLRSISPLPLAGVPAPAGPLPRHRLTQRRAPGGPCGPHAAALGER